MSKKEEKKSNVALGIVTYVVHIVARCAVVVALLLLTVLMVIVVGTRMFTPPEVYVVEITDKQIVQRSTRYSIHFQPTLVCNTTDGEELSVSVNDESYENVDVGDYIAVNAWRFRGEIVSTELNPTLNNTVKESEE